jgi:hypothetical protein
LSAVVYMLAELPYTFAPNKFGD